MFGKIIVAATAAILSLGLAGVANASTDGPHQVSASVSGSDATRMNPVQAAAYPCGDTFDSAGRLTFRNCSNRAVDVMPGYLYGVKHYAYFNAGYVTVPAHSAVQWSLYFTNPDVTYETLNANKYEFAALDITFLNPRQAHLLQCGTTNHPSPLATGPTDLVYKNCSNTTQDIAPGYQLGNRHHVYVNGGIVNIPNGYAIVWHLRTTVANSDMETIGIDQSSFIG